MDSVPTPTPTPTVLDYASAISMCVKCIEIGQSKGIFTLQEADLLARSVSVSKGGSDAEITRDIAKSVIIQAVQKIQKNGLFALQDASTMFKVVVYLSNENSKTEHVEMSVTPVKKITESASQTQQPGPEPEPSSDPVPDSVQEQASIDSIDSDDDSEYDLSELAKPIPMNTIGGTVKCLN
jgi:hypothetical protein